ncbi:LPS export ABC transporter periplasmic protein LptC [Candidatus Acetothermia bacterium]|nr:LPS export ABC transporter periplasmic protein LptC [Candidatus Acetothermia bacterium]MBI3643895.1 LPS export ABC transporter periplasmic protein LptC [Candidatus Acetothermia bacterium]
MPRSHTQQVFFLAAGAIALVFLLNSCAVDIPKDNSDPNRPAIELSQNDLDHYDDNGKLLWEMHADSVKFFDTAQKTEAERIKIQFSNADGQNILNVEAQHLVYDHRSGNLAFTGQIEAKDSSGISFTTADAFWDEAGKKLWSDSPIRVERDDFSLTGVGFEYKPDEGTLTTQTGHLQIILNP